MTLIQLSFTFSPLVATKSHVSIFVQMWRNLCTFEQHLPLSVVAMVTPRRTGLGCALMLWPHLSCRWAAPVDGPDVAAWWTTRRAAGEVMFENGPERLLLEKMWRILRRSGLDPDLRCLQGAWEFNNFCAGLWWRPADCTFDLTCRRRRGQSVRFTDCSVLEECPGTVDTESLTWLQLINNGLVSHSPFPRQRCLSAKQPSNY